MVTPEAALEHLLRRLKAVRYSFVAVTPLTHARVLARPWTGPATLRDIFGWNRSFVPSDLEPELLALLRAGAALQSDAEGFRSAVRVADLGGDLFLHSSFPTDTNDAVFFGPDTYRFARFLDSEMCKLKGVRRIIDMGAGSGAGGIVASRLLPNAQIALVDVNPAAMRLALINASAAGVRVETLQESKIPFKADLIIANPPYMVDPAGRAYRDGGASLGGEIALDWAEQGLATLERGGAMLLYTGAVVVDGRTPLLNALERACSDVGASLRVEDIDPDIFGEELEGAAYAQTERIAAIGVVIKKPA